jgi:hypothetical protein
VEEILGVASISRYLGRDQKDTLANARRVFFCLGPGRENEPSADCSSGVVTSTMNEVPHDGTLRGIGFI